MTAHTVSGPVFVAPDTADLPAWLCPRKPPELPGRQIKILDALAPKLEEPQGLKDYRAAKRAKYLAMIAAMGLTEDQYVLRKKRAAAQKRRERDRKAKKKLSPEQKRKKERAAFHKSKG